MFENYSDVVGIHDLMKMIGIGRNSAYKLLNSGEIPARRLTTNGKYLIDKENIIKYIRKQ